MTFNTITLRMAGCTEPAFLHEKERHGPSDLADVVHHFYDRDTGQLPPGYAKCLSREGIDRLIKLAFDVSLTEEEGRYPRFNIIAMKRFGPRSVLEFSPAVPIADVDTLRRLWPAAAYPECALRVAEDGGELTCQGIDVVGEMGHDTLLGRPEIVGDEPPSEALSLTVERPGHLVVGCITGAYELRGAKIRQLAPWSLVTQARQLTKDAAVAVAAHVGALSKEEALLFGGSDSCLQRMVEVVWSQVLSSAIRARHGGTFIFLPQHSKDDRMQDVDHAGIKLKHLTGAFDLGKEVSEHWKSCMDVCADTERPSRDSRLDRARRTRHRLFTKARALANLSFVDGCVVLNRSLAVLGFGGKIRASYDPMIDSTRSVRNAVTMEEIPEGEIRAYGTRHQSAIGFCQRNPGSLAFVISQDGDLRLFVDDDKGVYGFGPMVGWQRRTDVQ